MARNGSGTYSNPYSNFVSGTVISSTQVDANNSDIATALTQSIAVDGQSTVTANLPMNAKKLTGLAVGAAATDSLTLGQAQAEAMVWCGTAGGSANAITLSPTPAITAYAAGQRFVWKASGSVNTGATTVAVSGLGAIALQDNGSALAAGQHQANKIFMGILDTTSTVQVTQVQISGTDPLVVTSLTVSGTATVGGASQFNSTVTVGADGTGYDVTFHGDTASRYVKWDESADSLLFSDNAKAVFGQPGNDLQIVHDTNNSFITDAGTGNLYLDSNAGNIYLRVNASENALEAVGDGAVTLYHNGSPKIATSAAGVTVTGGVSGVTGINSGQIGGRRNIFYNGEMKVAQRSTSETGLGAASGYFTLDRWQMFSSTAGRFTMAQIADGPAGFANSLKLTTTTADTSIAASEIIVLAQNIEGQDVQQIKKGTASAEQLTLSFWVKGNASATYVAELFDADNTRQISKSFSVTTSWAKITLLIPADTTGVLDDNNLTSFGLNIWLHAGSTYTSGTLNSSAWAATTNANRAVGISSIVDSTSRTFFITGVQLEIGATATEFEHRTFGEELALCQRYLQSSWSQGSAIGSTVSSTANVVQQSWGSSNSSGIAGQAFVLPVTMRAIPTLVTYDIALNTGKVTAMNAGAGLTSNVSVNQNYTTTNVFQVRMYANSQHGIVFAYTLSAEL